MKGVSIRSTNIFLVVFFVAYIGLSLVAGLIIGSMDIPYYTLLLISEAIIILPVLVFMVCKKINPLKMDLMKLPRIGDVLLSYIYAYTLLPLIALLNLITMLFAKNQVNEMLGSVYDYPLWLQLILMALLPAIVEEFIFRGIFYTSYRRRNVLGAMLMSGLLFGLMHLNINQCAYAIVMGVAFGMLAEATGSVVNSMVAHFAINANSVFALAVSKWASSMSSEEYLELADGYSATLSQSQLLPALIMELAIIAGFAAGGIAIAICIIRALAKRSGRSEHIGLVMKAGFKLKNENTDPFFDIFTISIIIIVVAYMFTVM